MMMRLYAVTCLFCEYMTTPLLTLFESPHVDRSIGVALYVILVMRMRNTIGSVGVTLLLFDNVLVIGIHYHYCPTLYYSQHRGLILKPTSSPTLC